MVTWRVGCVNQYVAFVFVLATQVSQKQELLSRIYGMIHPMYDKGIGWLATRETQKHAAVASATSRAPAETACRVELSEVETPVA